jgi:hypothetical protein
MAGLCKSIKEGAKNLKRELTREVLRFTVETMGGIAPILADGRISKTEAGGMAATIVSGAKRISLGAANAAVTIVAAALKAEIQDDATPTRNQVQAVPVIVAEMDAAPDDLDEAVASWIDAA